MHLLCLSLSASLWTQVSHLLRELHYSTIAQPKPSLSLSLCLSLGARVCTNMQLLSLCLSLFLSLSLSLFFPLFFFAVNLCCPQAFCVNFANKQNVEVFFFFKENLLL